MRETVRGAQRPNLSGRDGGGKFSAALIATAPLFFDARPISV